MKVSKNDFFYILMAIAVAAVGAFAVSNFHSKIGLYGLLGLVGIAVVMIIIIQPSLGANILVFAVITNISDLLTNQGLPSLIKPLVVVVAFALVVRFLYTGQVPIGHSKTSRVEFFLLAYFMVVILSYLVASDKDRALEETLDLGKDIIIIYCILFALRQSHSWKQTAWLIMITTSALASLSMVQLVTHNFSQNFFGLSQIVMDQVFGDALTPRVGGPINAPNLWGQVLVAVSTLIIFRIIHEKSTFVKLGALFMLIVISYVILNTYSRGAYLVFVLDIMLILFVFEKRFNPLIAFAGLAILILLLPFVPATYRDRFGTLAFFGSQNGIYQDTSFRGRTSEMLTGLTMFTTHPILGVGSANYYNNYQQYAQLVGIEFRATARDPHSLYIQVLAETGIMGAITFFGLVFALLRALNKTYRAIERLPGFADWLPWINAIRMAILSYLLTSVFLHNAYIRYFWILVAMALASIQITYNMLSNTERSLSPEVHR